MKLEFTIGGKEKLHIVIKRNWFTGSFTYAVNGKFQTLQSAWNPTTHFGLKLQRTYDFEVSTREKHRICIEKIRPLLFAGFRPQEYKVTVDGNRVAQSKGF